MSFTVNKTQTIAGILDGTCLDALVQAVNDDVTITTVCEGVDVTLPDQLVFTFAGTGPLSGGEDAALDSLLAGFSCPVESDFRNSLMNIEKDQELVQNFVDTINFEGAVQSVLDTTTEEESGIEVTVTIGGESVRNDSGVTINALTPVYATGYDDTTNELLIAIADAGDANKMPAIGVLIDTLNNGESGTIQSFGPIDDVNTTGFTVRDPLYVAVGGGAYTNVKPTGKDNLIQKIGNITSVHATNGSIFVAGADRVNDIPNIEDGHVWLGNVSDVPTPTILNLDALTDVDTTTVAPTTNDILQFNGTNFVPVDPTGFGDIDEDNIIYVGKHGNDTKDGRTIDKAVLTFGQAVTLCIAETPSASDMWGIVCLDGGTYTENIALTTSYIRIFAAHATLVGQITLTTDTSFEFEHVHWNAAGFAVELTGGTTTAYGAIKHLEIDSGADGFCNTTASGILNVEVEFFKQTGGIGITNSSISHYDIQDWDVYGTSPTCTKGTGGMLNVRSANISDRGATTSLGFDVDGGTTNIVVNYSEMDTLCDVETGATLNLLGLSLTGVCLNDGTLREAAWTPGASTDNAVVRWDGTNGRAIQDSTVAIDDVGEVSGLHSLLPANTLTWNLGSASLKWNWIYGTRAVLENGTATQPSHSFAGNADTGMWSSADNVLDFSTGTTNRFQIEADGTLNVQTINYETLVTADDDIPNKKYVDDAVAGAGGGDVSGAGSSVDNRIPRWDGTTGTLLQNLSAGTDLFFTDAGEFNIVTDTTLYGWYITNNTAGGGFMNLQNHLSNNVMLVDADVSGNAKIEVFTNAGNKPLVVDNGSVKVGNTTTGVDTNYEFSVIGPAAGGNGFKLMAGEVLGDIAFHIADGDDTFQIMEMEADQGYVTMGKTYAQTLTDNGVVYGLDVQHDGTTSKDVNTQLGRYRMAGTPIPLATLNLFADQVEFPTGSDWNVNVGAPASADSNNAALTVRRFDDTTEEAFGFILTVPPLATEMVVCTKTRAETAPGATQTAVMKLHKRGIPDNGAVTVWSTNTLTNVSLPTNENFQYDATTDTLANWGMTAGSTYQMQISRDAGNVSDDLVGDLALLAVEIEFR